MSTDTRDGAAQASRVDDLLYRFTLLSETEQRQFHRKYASFRAVRRQFGGVFERMKAGRTPRTAAPADGPK